MKVAIIGSRSLYPEIKLDIQATEIVSGGAKGVDQQAEKYANKNGIKLTLFLPDYQRNGKAATHIRNRQIVDYSDVMIAYWDGKSSGTDSTIRYAKAKGKQVFVILQNQQI